MDPRQAVVLAYREGILPPAGTALVVGFSGGPDSTALLHALWTVGKWRLAAFHVDHGMRADSQFDAIHAKAWAQSFEIPSRTLRLPQIPKTEQEARMARHTALAAEARRVGAAAIALGHTADDQLETLLLRMTRGTGLKGLSGMSNADRGPCGIPILRPLLSLTRERIEAYNSSLCLKPVFDPSNQDPDYSTRNRIRLEVVPRLRKINERVAEAACRTASLLAAEEKALNEWAEQNLDQVRDPGAQGARSIHLKAFGQLPLALKRRTLRLLAPDLDFVAVEHLLGFAHGAARAHTHLSSGQLATRAKGWLGIRSGLPAGWPKCRICLTTDADVPSMEREFGDSEASC